MGVFDLNAISPQARAAFVAERRRLLAEGDYATARTAEQSWLAANPHDADAHNMAAWTLSAMGLVEDAVEHLRAAVARDPLETRYLENLAKAYEAAAVRTRARAEQSATARSKRRRLDQDAQRDRLAEHIRTILATALPAWEHATDISAKLRFEAELRAHNIDEGADWIQHAPPAVPQGSIVNFGQLGRFEVGDPRQVLHKRLARNIPWELVNTIVLMELAARCRPESLILDIGANVGALTVPVAKVFSGRVLAFEPAEQTHADLLRNLGLNELSNVTPIKAALSRSPGSGRMTDGRNNNPGTAQVDLTSDGGTAVTTLDLAVEGAPVGLIKMDVEGHEPEVIAGAVETLRRHRPIVLSELLEGPASEIGAAFDQLGYKRMRVHSSDWLFYPPY
ncbi:FkbM family methyltransferase [Methylobacterium sp. NI91]|nr:MULTISPECIES: FkbM family methyltransferase [unclassified Methylobacterium]QIJ76175.1 FkbM family methyltransferase [Methylobacterium sp. CLZ]QIJ81080.1 FkbM family methyltransferase [Methylobacterium sp. NI91]